MGTLILLRHGESTWNAENRFTGWVDVPLSPAGRAEAQRAGTRLAEAGIDVSLAFTSTLQRAEETGRLALAGLGREGLEQHRRWRLNERYYGLLTGVDKDEARRVHGEEQVHRWRRGYADTPPGGESLAHTVERVLPVLVDEILPAAEGADVLVSAHGNSLRAAVKHLEGLGDDEVPGLEIATGVPLVYRVDHGAAVREAVLD